MNAWAMNASAMNARSMNAWGALSLTAALVATATALPSAGHAQSSYGAQSGYGRLAGAPIRQAQLGPPSVGQTVSIDLSGPSAPVRTLALPKGKSAMIDLPTDARDVLVSDPKVADVVLSTPRRIYVLGVGSGQTDAAFMDASGRQILRLNIRVGQDVSVLGDTLNRLLPGSSIHVEAVNDSIVLSGEVANAASADKAVRLAGALTAKPEQVLNMLAVSESEQVMLKVRIVEVDRNIIKQLGFNLGAVTGQLGMPQYSFLNSPTYGVNGSFLGGASGGYSLNTTSQPLSALPFSNLFTSGLSTGAMSALQAAGIGLSGIAGAVSSFLSGTGSLSAAQQTAVSQYLNGPISTVSTQVTPVVNATTSGAPYTVTAASAGISTSNISTLEKAYLNGGSLPITSNGVTTTLNLTTDQKAWLNAFNTQLPTYNAAATGASVINRSNPAATVTTGLAGSTGLNQANAMIQAFERAGLVRTLAEPNLTAVSGESAKFLAGGEFPVPIGVDNNGRVTVEFKQYGVGLGFTPVVLSKGRISLKVSTEVSELTNTGGFTLSSSSSASSAPSLSIPGLNVRRAETTIELPSGQGMMIAGLLQSNAKETLDSVPGLQNLPVLGALFRSRDFINNETELVVIVTPYLVKPVNPDQLQTPADDLQVASDLETTMLGHLNTSFGKTTPTPKGGTYQGPIGYVVD